MAPPLFERQTRSRQSKSACPRLEVLEDRCTPASVPSGFSEGLTITGLNAPTSMHQASNGDIFITEKAGAVRIVRNGVLEASPFVTLTRVDPTSDGGLLSVTTDANFATNQYVYVLYTSPDPQGVNPFLRFNRVSRFTANGLVAGSGETVLFDLDSLAPRVPFHNGGSIQFGPDGRLYISTADAGNGNNSQFLNTHGKMLRINADGTIPGDNPFIGETTGNDQAIWALGLRNSLGFDFADDGTLFINDVGFSSFEEINQGQAGGNYGSPNVEGIGGTPTYLDPILTYAHPQGGLSTSSTGFHIAGGAFYEPATGQFPASAFDGDYFFADSSGWVRHFDRATRSSDLFAIGFTGPVDLLVSQTGSLWVLSRGSGSTTGQLTRIDFIDDLTANQKFVQTLYNDYLGRSGFQGEINSWATQIGPLSLVDVARSIAHSPEALGERVDALYVAYLGRAADADGRAFWVDYLTTHSMEDMLALLLASDEFRIRADVTVGGLVSDANYVRALYRQLLGREGSVEDVDGWMTQLASGHSRTEVALGFLRSAEFRAGAVRTFYGDPTANEPYQPYFANLLRRPTAPTPPEIASWVEMGVDLFSIELGIAGSLESFNNRSA